VNLDDGLIARVSAGVIAWFALGANARVTALTRRVARVTTDDGAFAVKVFAAAEKREGLVESAMLRALSRAVAQRPMMVRVQQLVASRDGAFVVEVGDADHVGSIAFVTRFEEGVQRSFEEVDDDTWFTLGRGLGALHDAIDESETLPAHLLPDLVQQLADTDVDSGRVRIEGQQRAWRDRGIVGDDYFDDRVALLYENAARVKDGIDGVSDVAGQVVAPIERLPIHNDYTVRNHLFARGAGVPPLILDFDRAVLAPREYEVVRCLNHLPLVAPTSAARFVDGYASLRALRRQALDWSVSAALLSHALKHWPVDRVLHGDRETQPLLHGSAMLAAALRGQAPALRAFFQQWTTP